MAWLNSRFVIHPKALRVTGVTGGISALGSQKPLSDRKICLVLQRVSRPLPQGPARRLAAGLLLLTTALVGTTLAVSAPCQRPRGPDHGGGPSGRSAAGRAGSRPDHAGEPADGSALRQLPSRRSDRDREPAGLHYLQRGALPLRHLPRPARLRVVAHARPVHRRDSGRVAHGPVDRDQPGHHDGQLQAGQASRPEAALGHPLRQLGHPAGHRRSRRLGHRRAPHSRERDHRRAAGGRRQQPRRARQRAGGLRSRADGRRHELPLRPAAVPARAARVVRVHLDL